MSGVQWFLVGVLVVASWAAVVVYSKRRFTLLGCRSCGSTGKVWEPIWMAWLCFRTRPAFHLCTSCGGSARYDRKRYLGY